MYENLYLEGVGGFGDDYYWSSSEGIAGLAWYQYFFIGYQGSYYKYFPYRVRAVRAF
jgi:hypothetical protein